ncbi:hypothetical protein TNCV_3718581 [Trichonephila clavipes]|nr:hypothetical protein TNCV_3718581 [Trichonephila clavipes]
MAFRCPTCNADFPDFEPHFDHECKTQNKQELILSNMDGMLMYPNVSDSFKTLNERHVSNIPLKKEGNKYLFTDMSAEIESLKFDFSNYDENELRDETKKMHCC